MAYVAMSYVAMGYTAMANSGNLHRAITIRPYLYGHNYMANSGNLRQYLDGNTDVLPALRLAILLDVAFGMEYAAITTYCHNCLGHYSQTMVMQAITP